MKQSKDRGQECGWWETQNGRYEIGGLVIDWSEGGGKEKQKGARDRCLFPTGTEMHIRFHSRSWLQHRSAAIARPHTQTETHLMRYGSADNYKQPLWIKAIKPKETFDPHIIPQSGSRVNHKGACFTYACLCTKCSHSCWPYKAIQQFQSQQPEANPRKICQSSETNYKLQ